MRKSGAHRRETSANSVYLFPIFLLHQHQDGESATFPLPWNWKRKKNIGNFPFIFNAKFSLSYTTEICFPRHTQVQSRQHQDTRRESRCDNAMRASCNMGRNYRKENCNADIHSRWRVFVFSGFPTVIFHSCQRGYALQGMRHAFPTRDTENVHGKLTQLRFFLVNEASLFSGNSRLCASESSSAFHRCSCIYWFSIIKGSSYFGSHRTKPFSSFRKQRKNNPFRVFQSHESIKRNLFPLTVTKNWSQQRRSRQHKKKRLREKREKHSAREKNKKNTTREAGKKSSTNKQAASQFNWSINTAKKKKELDSFPNTPCTALFSVRRSRIASARSQHRKQKWIFQGFKVSMLLLLRRPSLLSCLTIRLLLVWLCLDCFITIGPLFHSPGPRFVLGTYYYVNWMGDLCIKRDILAYIFALWAAMGYGVVDGLLIEKPVQEGDDWGKRNKQRAIRTWYTIHLF